MGSFVRGTCGSVGAPTLLTRTLAQLRTELLVKAGMNSSGTSVDLTPAVLNGLINRAVFEAWDIIVNKDLDYHTSLADVAVIAGTDTYALPVDFYKLRVVWILDGGRYLRLRPASLDAAHTYTGQAATSKSGYRYRLTNRNLVLMPTPGGTETVRVFYVPSATELANDADALTIDVPVELQLVLSIAWREVLNRQNLDPSPALQDIATYTAQLRVSADGLDSEPFYLSERGPSRDDEESW